MGNMNKLLYRTVKPISVYALLVLLLSIPAYYFIVDRIWVNELDKHHYALRGKIESRFTKLQLPDSTIEQTIAIWNKIEPGSVFTPHPTKNTTRDSIYSVIRFDDYMQDREQFRCLSTSIMINQKHYRLLLETNMEETDETVMAISIVAIFFFLLLLGGLIFLLQRLSSKIWRPFYASLDALKAFRLTSDEPIRFEPSAIQEFNELNDSLSRLTERNINTYKQQKEFTENASHELQTPLAIVQSKLDLLFQDQSLSKGQSAIVADSNSALARISRINKNLLLLAKIENQQFEDAELLDLSVLLQETADMIAEHLDNKQLSIEMNIHPGVSVHANGVLLEVMLNNLFVNAVRHTPKHGIISVNLDATGLRISNTGTTGLDPEKLFRRFSNTSSLSPGTGLGLTIIKEICDRYSWPISYDFENARHTFHIHFYSRISPKSSDNFVPSATYP
jgi:signal transduction histidine kinase